MSAPRYDDAGCIPLDYQVLLRRDRKYNNSLCEGICPWRNSVHYLCKLWHKMRACACIAQPMMIMYFSHATVYSFFKLHQLNIAKDAYTFAYT